MNILTSICFLLIALGAFAGFIAMVRNMDFVGKPNQTYWETMVNFLYIGATLIIGSSTFLWLLLAYCAFTTNFAEITK